MNVARRSSCWFSGVDIAHWSTESDKEGVPEGVSEGTVDEARKEAAREI